MDPIPVELNVAIAFDQNYLAPVYALLASVFINNTQESIAFHAIVTGITDEQKAEIQEFVEAHNVTITFYKIDESFAAGFLLPESMWWTPSIYYRLLFPALLPASVNRFLYLDTDIIVLGRLAELFATNMAGKPLAAVLDKIDFRPELGITKLDSYFNSGVLLIDKQLWVKQDISAKAIAFIVSHANILSNPDQDALNAVLVDNWIRLDNRFNLMFQDIPETLAKRDYANFLRDTVILHYTTQHKPWAMIGRNRLRYLYHYYSGKAPRKYRVQYTDFVWDRHKIREMLEIRLVEHLIDHPVLEAIWPKNRD